MNVRNIFREEAEKLGKNEEIRKRQVAEYAMSIKFTDGHIHNVLPDDEKNRVG